MWDAFYPTGDGSKKKKRAVHPVTIGQADLAYLLRVIKPISFWVVALKRVVH